MPSPTAPRFSVDEGEIIDTVTREIISPERFDRIASPADKQLIENQLQSGEQAAELDTEEPVPSTPSIQPIKNPTWTQFRSQMRSIAPHADEKVVADYWNKTYGHLDPKKLPSLDRLTEDIKAKKPDADEGEIRDYWQQHYGVFGAREHGPESPGVIGTAKDIGLKVGQGVVDVAQSVVGLFSLASGGKVGETLRDLGFKPDEAKQYLQEKTSEAQQVQDEAVAKANGFVDTLIEYAKNPRALAGGVAESAPGMALMMGATGKAASAIAQRAAAPFGGLATEAGAAAARKAVEESAKKLIWTSAATEGALATGQIADQAQGGGKEWSEYLLPSIGAGMGTAAIAGVTGGILGSAEVGAVTGGVGGIKGSLLRRVPVSIFSEGFEELGQSGWEQAMQNIANGKPWSEGVPEAMASGLAVGGALGGVMGGVQRPTPPPPAPEKEPEPQPIPRFEPVPFETPKPFEAQPIEGPYEPPQSLQQYDQPFPSQEIEPPHVGPLPFQTYETTQQFDDLLSMVNDPSKTLDETIQKAQALIDSPVNVDAIIDPTDVGLFSQADVMGAARTRQGEDTAIIEPATEPLRAIPFQATKETEKYPAAIIPKGAPRPTRASLSRTAQLVEGQAPPLEEPSLIQPGTAFTPKQAPEKTARERLADERARLLSWRASRTPPAQVAPLQEQPGTLEPEPLRAQADLIYPSPKEVRALVHEKGFHLDTPVFREVLKQTTGQTNFADLSPGDLQKLKDALTRIKPSSEATAERRNQEVVPPISTVNTAKQDQPAPPINLPTEEVSRLEQASKPRSELTPTQNVEMLLRAQKAEADLQIAGKETGRRAVFEDNPNAPGQTVTGLQSAAPDWYRALTTKDPDTGRVPIGSESPTKAHPKGRSARQKIEEAIQKIIQDEGADRGAAVEKVKQSLLADQEFRQTEWGRDLESILQGEWPSWVEQPAGQVESEKIEQETPPPPTAPAMESKPAAPPSPEGQARTGEPGAAPSNSRTERIKNELEKIEQLRGKIKDRSLIYQADRKDEVAKQLGIPAETLYEMPNEQWSELDKKATKQERLKAELEKLEKSKNVEQVDIASSSYSDLVRMMENGAAARRRLHDIPESRYREVTGFVDSGMKPTESNIEKWLETKGIIGAVSSLVKEIQKHYKDAVAAKMEGAASRELSEREKSGDLYSPRSVPKQQPAAPTEQRAENGKTPREEPFTLTAPEVKQAKPKPEDTQTSIPMEPETIGSRPIIGREAQPEEAPLFSKAAQTPEAEQTTLPEASASVKQNEEPPRRSFSLTRVDPKTDEPFTQTFSLGDWVSVTLSKDTKIHGTITGISQAKQEAKIDNLWYEFGRIYPATVPEPQEKTQPTELLSTLVQKAEKAPPGGWQEGDKVSTEAKPAPTTILANALRSAADQIEGKPAQTGIATLEQYNEFRKRLIDGEVTLDEFRAAFAQVEQNKDALLAILKKLNKEQLVKQSNSLHARLSDSKDLLIRQAYDAIFRGFTLNRGVSYMMSGKNAYEQAVRKMVDETTSDDLATFAKEVAARKEEYKKKLEGFANPQTLEDFDTRVRIKGEASLSPEQLARYDELLAQAGRAKRQQAQEQKATVSGVNAGTDLQLIESKHTKTGEALWVVKLADRVDRAVYDRLNQAAKKLGGRYSSYNKDGAIPGFTFRSKEAAESFVAAGKGETVSAAPVREAARAEVQDNAVSRLRDMADKLESKADDVLNADRKTNTARRAAQASATEGAAYADKALAQTMKNLADAIESGEATHLNGLRTKAQVEMLDSTLEQAKRDRITKETKGSYVDYERQKDRKAEPEDAAFAHFPTFTLYKDNLGSALVELKKSPGTERLRLRLQKLMMGTAEGGKREVSREDAELAISKLPPSKYPPAPFWQWNDALAKLKRLESMGITSLPELRAALREFVDYRGKRGTIDKAKQLERNLIGSKGIGNDFFPTPKATAERMVREADIQPGMKVLEPSAGNGNISEAIKAAGVNPDVVEMSSALREILEAKGFNLVGRDFMDVTEGGYDRIVMNPPFSNGQDAEHIQHAYELLKPGGKLVAIAGEGIFFRGDAKATAFRDWLAQHDGTEEKLEEGTFKDTSLMATTGVNARLVIVGKPEAETGTSVRESQSAYQAPTFFSPTMRQSVLTEGQSLFENSHKYEVRPGEQTQLNFDLAEKALGAVDEAGSAVSSLRGEGGLRPGEGRTLGLGISPDLIHQGVVDLRGYTVRSAEDLAKLAQVYRNPLFETFRYIFTKNGEIVHHEGVTSRLPGYIKLFHNSKHRQEVLAGMKLNMEALGADGYWLLHNHPSGNSQPSQHDLDSTKHIAEGLPGFLGHVVIDSNEYSTIGQVGARFEQNTHKFQFGDDRLLKPSLPHPMLETHIGSQEHVAQIAKNLQTPKQFVTVLYRASNGRVRAIQELSVDFLSNYGLARDYLQKRLKAFGAAHVVTHYLTDGLGDEPDRIHELTGSMHELITDDIVMDHITEVSPSGRLLSLNEAGSRPQQDMYQGVNLESPETGIERVAERAAPYEAGTIDPPTAKDKLTAASASLRPYLLGALGLQQIADVYGKDHPEVRQYNQALHRMEADFTESSNQSDALLRQWDALKTTESDAMARIMEEARILQFDPDPDKKQAPDNPLAEALRTRFDALPGPSKTLYRHIRDFYTAMSANRFAALEARIERMGGTPENKKAALDKLRVAYDQTKSAVYFPFSRFGDHIVVARKMQAGTEVDREVQTFDSPMEAQKFALLMKGRGWMIKQTTAKEYSLDKDGAASKLVKDILNTVQSVAGDESSVEKQQLLDALNQTFLNALPDMSYAKHFIHAREVKGWSKDALRAFAHSALHGAHHISRIKYGDQLTRALSRMDERINTTAEGDVTEARQVSNELVQRHDQIMNPNIHPVAAWLGQLGFTMSLGGVVATGLTNMTQVPLITMPWLGSRFGFTKSSAALTKAYKDFLDPKTLNADSLFDASKSKRISEAERAMLKELQRRGRIDLTQTMDLAGRASQDNLSRVARQVGTVSDKITRLLGFTFHAPEVMNRQVTALASFRLAKAKEGTSDQEAVDLADQAIRETHFIYSASNRPRYMSGNVLRVLTMFKQYSQNVAYLYGRAASVWLSANHASPEERAQAKRQLLAMTSLQFAAAGALGMPFIGTAAALVTAVLNGLGDDDEKKDWDVELRKILASFAGKEGGEVLAHGASRLTPWDMAGRLGQNDLFFRAPRKEREGRAAAMDWITSLAGPVLSYSVNAYLGVGDVASGLLEANQGRFLRGVEELVPAVLRNSVKALRYDLEGGVRTRDQYRQMELDSSEKLGQLFGFTPSRAAEMYEGVTAIKNQETRITDRRNALLGQFAASVQDKNTERKQETIQEIQTFNQRHPTLRINGETLIRSLKARQKREAGMEGGVYLPKNRQALRETGAFANY